MNITDNMEFSEATAIRVNSCDVPCMNPETADRLNRELSALIKPNMAIYWCDYLCTVVIAYSTFILSLYTSMDYYLRAVLLIISMLAHYRALAFIHEIAHQGQNNMKLFKTVWNLFTGIPFFMPSILYQGMHIHHHQIRTYGTNEDPEYLPLAGKPFVIVILILSNLFNPLLLAIRFIALAPFGLVFSQIRKWLISHASSLTMNFRFVRNMNEREDRELRIMECSILVFWLIFTIALFDFGPKIPLLVSYYLVFAGFSVLNCIRSLVAHRYESDGTRRELSGQIDDSIDVPGHWWTALWAPVGLRYHALHHYRPGIPYHNLGYAYRILMTKNIKINNIDYKERIPVKGLLTGLSRLLRVGNNQSSNG